MSGLVPPPTLPKLYRQIQIFETVYGRMILGPIDALAYAYMTHTKRSYDDCEIQSARRYLATQPPGIVIDVGASFGTWSLGLAPLSTHVYAFEPQRAVYNMLCGSIALNSLDHVVSPYNCALGGSAGTASIQRLKTTLPGWSGGLALDHSKSTIFTVQERERLGAEQPLDEFDPVTIRRLDEWHFDGKVTLIKIDTQGMEESILRGGAKTILTHNPLMVVEWTPDTRLALNGCLDELGYEVKAEGHDNLVCVSHGSAILIKER